MTTCSLTYACKAFIFKGCQWYWEIKAQKYLCFNLSAILSRGNNMSNISKPCVELRYEFGIVVPIENLITSMMSFRFSSPRRGDRDEQDPLTLSSTLAFLVIISISCILRSLSIPITTKSFSGLVQGLIESIWFDNSVSRMRIEMMLYCHYTN